jgi:ribA/ribD-fused uncharacterized protein
MMSETTADTPIRLFHGEHAFLSNFYPSPLDYEGLTYPTVEHAYQAAKVLDQDGRIKLRDAATPGAVKRMGARVKRRKDWFSVNLGIMTDLIRQKFTRYPDLGEWLLLTGDRELIEGNNWGDDFFGMVKDDKTGQWRGENHLGKMLMQVRAELREQA